MYKIRKISFKNHPILKNLTLDFCDCNGNAVDTVIFAGENGTGKSTILDYLYTAFSGKVASESIIELEREDKILVLEFCFRESNGNKEIWVKDSDGLNTIPGLNDFKEKYPASIFSEVDINFHGNDISNVTSSTVDTDSNSRRSTNNLPTLIKQLLVDIDSLDNDKLAREFRLAKSQGKDTNEISPNGLMDRFKKAFNQMFETLTYSHIENTQGQKKTILFKKYGAEIPIDDLSSGEKQIVYRGCFLLKDANVMTGAFVFIDEPEISLHPTWQEKIMDYYKGIFTDENDKQTSQIFAVTHSPFIIHNENRRNDKVIVLERDINGDIIVKDKPEYYMCNSMDVVHDAFSIHGFSEDRSTVFLEGRTDEKYFRKAIEVFGYDSLPFDFQWVGYMRNEKDEENTGKDALNKAAQFLIGRNLPRKNVCLFDCDTGREEYERNKVFIRVMPTFPSTKKMKKGIENALVLDFVDTSPFYEEKIKEGDYGDDKVIKEFQKMKFCDSICKMDSEQLQKIFVNLKRIIDSLIKIFEGE